MPSNSTLKQPKKVTTRAKAQKKCPKGIPAQAASSLPVHSCSRGKDHYLYCVHQTAKGKQWVRYIPSQKWCKTNLKK